MNKLTKLMLASAVLATSGFATGGEEATPSSILNGTKVVGAGGIFEIENADYVVSTTGSFELMKGDDGEGGKLKIGSGSTMEVSGGKLISTGEGSKAPKIELNGTLEISENGGKLPTVNLTGVTIVGSSGDVKWTDGNYNYDVSSLTMGSESQVIGDNNYLIGKINDEFSMTTTVLERNDDLWVLSNAYMSKDGLSGYQIKWKGSADVWGISDNGVYIGNQIGIGSGTDVLSGDAYVSNYPYGFVVFKKLSKVEEGGESTIDLSGLRSGDGYKNTIDATSAVVGLVPDGNCEVVLPVNCKFSSLNLNTAKKVSYTKYVVGESSAPGINGSYEIRLIKTLGTTYGDYSDGGLGVTLPGNDKQNVTTKDVEGTTVEMNLADIVKNTEYNSSTNTSALKLWTDDLNSAEHAITEDTTYNFGFAGSKAVKITGTTGVATFAGDNSTYAPKNAVTLPEKVAFAASKSLFKFDINVESLEFKGGTSAIENTVASETTVETNVLNVGVNHKVIVNGHMKLVGAQASE